VIDRASLDVLELDAASQRKVEDTEEWTTILVVLHGGVNRALLSRCLAGPGAFFGHLEQSFACINIIDGGPGDFVVRTVNLTPYDPMGLQTRKTAIEQVLDEYRSSQAAG